MKRSLVRGASGFLGWDVCQGAKSDRMVFGTFLSHPINIPDIRLLQIDLTKFRELKQLFKEVEPDAVIHTAGITDPDFFSKKPFS